MSLLVDTDVMVWALRGNAKADQMLMGLAGFWVPAVAYMELLQGTPDSAQLRTLKSTFSDWQARIVWLNEAMSSRAVLLMEQRLLSHGLHMGDAFIAATALEKRLPLLTGNVRHFKGIPGLAVKAFKP